MDLKRRLGWRAESRGLRARERNRATFFTTESRRTSSASFEWILRAQQSPQYIYMYIYIKKWVRLTSYLLASCLIGWTSFGAAGCPVGQSCCIYIYFFF